MHGIRRVPRPLEDLTAERKAKERAKIEQYTALEDRVLALKKARDYSEDAFDLTTQLITMNPEYYTIWNYRRDILTNSVFPSSTPLNIYVVLKEDLNLTLAALKQHPKVYWIWNHRRWCLAAVPLTPDDESRRDDELDWRREVWTAELFVVEKLLEADARNFHAWNYRRYVLSSLPPPPPNSNSSSPAHTHTPSSELTYTRKKIEANFSNFSAWHQRTKVYDVTGELKDASRLDEEFDFVIQAMYTLPEDQSAWLYHRWLIAQTKDTNVIKREITLIHDLLAEEPDSKWCLESLIQYTLLLHKLKLKLAPSDAESESDAESTKKAVYPLSESDAESTKKAVYPLLERLEGIDPMRRGRYGDLRRGVDGL